MRGTCLECGNRGDKFTAGLGRHRRRTSLSVFIGIELAIGVRTVENRAHVGAIGIVGARQVLIRPTWLHHGALLFAFSNCENATARSSPEKVGFLGPGEAV
jgi:hypothetical protein